MQQQKIKNKFKEFCKDFSKICLGIVIGVTSCVTKTYVLNSQQPLTHCLSEFSATYFSQGVLNESRTHEK